MANVTCVACGHRDQGDSAYCVNPACGVLLSPVDRTMSAPDLEVRRDVPEIQRSDGGMVFQSAGIGHETAAGPVGQPAPAPVVVASPLARKRPGRRQFVLAAALVTVAALTVTALALLRDDDPVAEIPRATSASMSPELVAPVVDNARPTKVEVRDEQTVAVVRWADSNQSNDQHLVQVLAANAAMRPRFEAVAVPSGEFRVTGLDANTGYCFRVGVVVFWDDPAVVAWSEARCIRGATWRNSLG